MTRPIVRFAAAIALLVTSSVQAGVTCTEAAGDPAMAGGGVASSKRTVAALYLTAAEAHPLIAAQPEKVLFLDVRTPAELMFSGVPAPIDANVPVMLLPAIPAWDAQRNAFRLEPNPDFVAEAGRRLAAKGLCPDDPVVLICLGGERAALAANLLTQAGYTQVFTIVDGFEGDLAPDGPTKGQRTVNGWKNAGLPWSYTLSRAKMYKAE